MLNSIEHENSFITSGPGQGILCFGQGSLKRPKMSGNLKTKSDCSLLKVHYVAKGKDVRSGR